MNEVDKNEAKIDHKVVEPNVEEWDSPKELKEFTRTL